MRPVLFDASFYVAALRGEDDAAIALRRVAADAPVWLSAVVLQELYAGAGNHERSIIERMERDFEKVKRIVVPNRSDWRESGRALARLAAKYDYEQIGRSRLSNDALIAVSAGRVGIRVLTTNQKDFRRLAEFFPFHWELIEV